MAPTSKSAPQLLRCALQGVLGLCCALIFVSCATTPPLPAATIEPAPEAPAVLPDFLPKPAPPVVHADPVPVPVVPRPAPIAVVVSSDLPTFRLVEEALVTQLKRPYKIYRLDTSSPIDVREALTRKPVKEVVAIGRDALEALDGLPDIDVIYAQIFVAPPDRYRGVAAVPPFEMQLEYWKSLAPNLKRVGVIASAKMRPIMDALQAAAEAEDIQLIRREVTSDKEALFEFRRMTPDVDGFVFLPDDTVLSPDVIRRALEHGARNAKEILTYSPAIFRLGASLYVASAHTDVAAQIIAMLDNPSDRSRPLTQMRVRIKGSEADIDVIR